MIHFNAVIAGQTWEDAAALLGFMAQREVQRLWGVGVAGLPRRHQRQQRDQCMCPSWPVAPSSGRWAGEGLCGPTEGLVGAAEQPDLVTYGSGITACERGASGLANGSAALHRPKSKENGCGRCGVGHLSRAPPHDVTDPFDAQPHQLQQTPVTDVAYLLPLRHHQRRSWHALAHGPGDLRRRRRLRQPHVQCLALRQPVALGAPAPGAAWLATDIPSCCEADA